MEDLRRIAFETVLRACAFALLGIFCCMVGLSFEPRLAFQSGGFLVLVMVGVLVVKAWEARTKDHRRTEMWLYLSKEQRPAPGAAQRVTSAIMQETYLTFALWTAKIAGAMWLIAFVLAMAGL